MKIKKLPVTERLLIAVGLLLSTTPQMLRFYFPIPDFFLGALVGVGLALEITGFIRLRRIRTASRTC